MSLEVGYRFYRLRSVEWKRIYIERTAISFAQKVDGLSVGSQYRITVFAGMLGKVDMFPALNIVHPYVTGDGRCVMFSPFIFETFTILIEEMITGFIEADCFGRCTQYLLRSSAGYRNFVKFSHGTGGKQGTACRILNRG